MKARLLNTQSYQVYPCPHTLFVYLQEPLASGQYCTVHEARIRDLQGSIALKRLKSPEELEADGFTVDEHYRQYPLNISNEALMQAMAANNGLAPRPMFITKDAIVGIGMELLTGDTLEQRCLRRGTPPTPEEFDTVYEALSSLGAIGIIHGDVTPRNIMFTPKGVRFVDFSRAHVASPSEKLVRGAKEQLHEEIAYMVRLL